MSRTAVLFGLVLLLMVVAGSCSATQPQESTPFASVIGKVWMYVRRGQKRDHTLVLCLAAVPGQLVGVTPFNEMLRAANLVRAAAGWPALGWSNILSSSDPLPAPGSTITARQVMACRARINEALQALGVVVGGYTNSDLLHLPITAASINEVQQRAQ